MSSTDDALACIFLSFDRLTSSCKPIHYISATTVLDAYKSTFALKVYISSANSSPGFSEDMTVLDAAATARSFLPTVISPTFEHGNAVDGQVHHPHRTPTNAILS